MLLAEVTIADFAQLGQLAAILAVLYGMSTYLTTRDKADREARLEVVGQYAALVTKVDNTIREVTNKFDTTVREFKAETRDLVDSSMALTEKSVEAIVGFRGSIQELKEGFIQLKGEFDRIKGQQGGKA